MAYSVLTVADKKKSPYYREFILDTASDLSSLPTNQNQTDNPKIDEKNYCATGSIAFVIATSNVYMLNSQGEWVLL